MPGPRVEAAAMREVLEHALRGEGGVDLHCHTVHSDGHWSPSELVRDAAALGIRVLAVTDHDTVSGLAEAIAAATRHGLALIPGIEVTLQHAGSAYHLLCYDVDPASEVWAEVARRRRAGEQRYYRRMLELIRAAGYAVRDEDVLQPDGSYPPHAATGALQAAGYADSHEAAARLLSSMHLPYPYELLAIDSRDLADLLPRDAALCVIAHAGRAQPGVCVKVTSRDVAELKRMLPLVGLEAYHPYHAPADVVHCLQVCSEYGLGTTAGSDAHGWNVQRPPRAHPPSLSLRLLELVRERWAGVSAPPSGQGRSPR